MALRHAGAAIAELEGISVGVELVGRLGEVAVGLSFTQSRRQVGSLVLRGVGAITRGRLDVDGRGGLCHAAHEADVRRGAGWEQRKAAIARVLEEEVEFGFAAGHKLVRLALPGVGQRRRALVGTAKMWRDGVLCGSGDGSARCGGFAWRVGEGWRRGLVGIQLHGEVGGLGGGTLCRFQAGGRATTVGAAPDDCAVGCSERGCAATGAACCEIMAVLNTRSEAVPGYAAGSRGGGGLYGRSGTAIELL